MINSLLKKGKTYIFWGFVCLFLSMTPAKASNTQDTKPNIKQKVILDTDMVEMFDDGVAMMMLLNSSEIDLVGVVVETGNSWANDGMAYLVKQLKAINKLDNAPDLAIGLHYPNRKAGGFSKEILKKELATYGDVMEGYIGAPENERPTSWQESYKKHYNEEAPNLPIKDGVDYLIEMVHKYPHQITIAAIGPTASIAKAIEKDPEFANLADNIVIMGGAFWVKGNADEAAEFNVWFDPESTKKVYNTAFDHTTIVALDVTDKTIMDKDKFIKIREHIKNPILLDMYNRSFFAQSFDNNVEGFSWFVWDVLVSAIIIDPSLIISTKYAYVDCITEKGAEYGKTVPYTKYEAPKNSKPASIIQEIDQERFWNMLYKSLESL